MGQAPIESSLNSCCADYSTIIGAVGAGGIDFGELLIALLSTYSKWQTKWRIGVLDGKTDSMKLPPAKTPQYKRGSKYRPGVNQLYKVRYPPYELTPSHRIRYIYARKTYPIPPRDS